MSKNKIIGFRLSQKTLKQLQKLKMKSNVEWDVFFQGLLIQASPFSFFPYKKNKDQK